MMKFDNIYLFYLVFGVLFAILLICGIRKNNSEEILTKQQSQSFKGVFIVLIFIHHFVIRMENQGYLYPFSFVGYIAVAGFFLFSGYGLMRSYIINKEYLKNFLSNKLLRIYIPTTVSTLLVGIIAVVIRYNNSNIGDIVYRSFTLRLITRFDLNWYVTATLIFYLIFFITLKFIKHKYAITCMFLLNCIYIVVGYFIGLGSWWINTALIFPLGVLIAYKKELLEKILKTNYLKILISITIIFGVVFIITCANITSYLIMSTLSGITFAILIMVISYKFTIKSKVFEFMGIISFELYLIHSQLFDIINGRFNISSQLTWIGIFAVIILLSYLLNKITTFFISKLKSLSI